MRWVSYTRATSCVEENSPSDIINTQNQVITDFMKTIGWKVEKKYSDRKISQDETGVFDRMVQDGLHRCFDGVVVSSIFRCGRNFAHAEEILEDTFFPAGIQFAVAEDQFCSIGKTKEEIREYFRERHAVYYGKIMTNQVDRQVEQGRIPFQLRTYGYVLSEDNSSLKIEEEGASVVLYIFQRFAEGKSYAAIARELSEKGELAPQEQMAMAVGKRANILTSAKWRSNTVKRILGSAIYTGKTSCMVDGVKMEYEVPAIISQEMYDTAQIEMEKIQNSHKNHNQIQTQSTSLLYKRIYDKTTGLPMNRVNNPMTENEKGYLPGAYRRCSKKMRDQLVPEKNVIAAIIERLEMAGEQVQYVDQILKTDDGKHEKELALSPCRNRAKQIISEMDMTYKERMEIHQNYDAGGICDADFQKKEDSFQDQFRKYEDEFKKIMADVRIIEKTYSNVNPWLVYYREIQIPSELDHDYIKKWIDRVLVEDAEHIEIILKETEWMDRLPQKWLQCKTEEL